MAKLSEAIGLPVAYTTHDVAVMFNTYVPWPGIEERASWELHGTTSDRIEIRVHGESWGDHRRYWRIFSVWLDGKPVVVGRHAGREGDDSVDRVILDRERYLLLAATIAAMLPLDIGGALGELMEDKDLGDITRWYGEYVTPGKVLQDLGWRL